MFSMIMRHIVLLGLWAVLGQVQIARAEQVEEAYEYFYHSDNVLEFKPQVYRHHNPASPDYKIHIGDSNEPSQVENKVLLNFQRVNDPDYPIYDLGYRKNLRFYHKFTHEEQLDQFVLRNVKVLHPPHKQLYRVM